MNDKRTITADEYAELCESLNYLAALLLEVGIVELRISKAKQEIFWDTEGKGQVSPAALAAFVARMERHFIERMAEEPPHAPSHRHRRA